MTLKHTGILLFHLPFRPVQDEVVYMENEYDPEANRFILENMEMISAKISAKGYRFVYLPHVNFSKETVEKAVKYHYPDGLPSDVAEKLKGWQAKAVRSDFLLDYMVKSRNRKNIRSSFVWFNRCRYYFDLPTFIYDGISFVGSEALENPELIMDEICEELGECNDWTGALNCTVKIEGADGTFYTESRKMLEEIREKLNKIRLSGVSESVIAEYIRPEVKLSPLRITDRLGIFLTDFENKEVAMEPINKAVFLLFLRHPEGIVFKNLPDYRRELSIIYGCVRSRKNEIERLLADKDYDPIHCSSVLSVTDPTKNSINEKCARVREAFLLLMPDVVAVNYYVTGTRGLEKSILLDRSLVSWEIADE